MNKTHKPAANSRNSVRAEASSDSNAVSSRRPSIVPTFRESAPVIPKSPKPPNRVSAWKLWKRPIKGFPIAWRSSLAQRSEKSEPNPMAIIRHKNAILADVRLRWSHEVTDGKKLIRGRMETEPGDNSSISF